MSSRFSASLLFLIFIVYSVSYPQKKMESPGSKSLLGKWETVDQASGTTITYQYEPGSQFRYFLTSALYGKYKLIGNRLISFYKIPSLKRDQMDTSIVFVRLDTLYQVTTSGNKEIVNKLVRLNGKGHLGAGIIGEWITTAGIRKNIFIFKPNGSLELRNIMRDMSGKYSVNGDNVSLISRGTTVMKYRFAFDKGMLLLYVDNVSAPIKLKRVGR